jgi:hypothetical protein
MGHLKSFPSLQDQYTEEKEDRGAFIAKGIRIKPRELIDAELIADKTD